MAISNTNELNELFELALGEYWIERGLPADKIDLGLVDDHFRSSAEVLMSYQETMAALQQGVDVDHDLENRMWGGLHRTITELASVFLFIADSARSYEHDAELHAEMREGAEKAFRLQEERAQLRAEGRSA